MGKGTSPLPVLILGAGGQLGSAFARQYGERALGLDRHQCDVTDRSQVEQVIGTLHPEVVINCAAMTDVDACESDLEQAGMLNALAPGHIADASRRYGARMVQISTDFVFDGSQAEPYLEWQATNPVNIYGRTKLAGERLVQQQAPGALVVRTAWLFAGLEQGFLEWVAASREKSELAVLETSIGSPSYATDVAAAVVRLIQIRASGVVHVVNGGAPTTRREMASVVLESLGSACSVIPQDPATYARPAERPRNSALDTRYLERLGVSPLRDWRDAVQAAVKESM